MDFVVYDFIKSFQILKKASSILPCKKDLPVVYVFAGPNASGKSTLIANLYQQNIITVPYLNADIFTKLKFAKVEEENERNYTSMIYTMNLAEKYITNKLSFCYETVLSHSSKIDLLEHAKNNGFKIISTFVFTEDVEINLKRLQDRVKGGGHDVPREKMISRYCRSVELSKKLKDISDEFYCFDNSENLK